MKKNFTETDPYKIDELARVIKKLFPDKWYRVEIPFGSKDIEITIKGVKQ